MWRLMEIASGVERMVLPVDSNFEKDQTTDADKLIKQDMSIPNPFSPKTINNFNLLPPFGLYNILSLRLQQARTRHLQVIGRLSLIRRRLRGIFTNCPVKSRESSCVCSQSMAFHENQTGWKKGALRSLVHSQWWRYKPRQHSSGMIQVCEGSRDGGCKHIVAAMYDLEDLLNSQGKDSVTSAPASGLKDWEQILHCMKLKIWWSKKVKSPPTKRKTETYVLPKYWKRCPCSWRH